MIHVGLIGPVLSKKNQNLDLLQPFCVRRAILLDFLLLIAPSQMVTVSELFDPVGPVDGTIVDIDCLVVSEETKAAIPFVETRREETNKKLKEMIPNEGSPSSHSHLLLPMNYVIIPLAEVPTVSPTSHEKKKTSSSDLRTTDASKAQL